MKFVLQGGWLFRFFLFWYYFYYSGGLGGWFFVVICEGDYKFIEFFEDYYVELYNVIQDEFEEKDLL